MFPMRLLLRRLLASALMVVALAFAAGCAGTSAPINPDPAAPTATLSATPTSVTAGGAVTLTWSTSNANSVTIDQGIGTVLASGQRIVSPASTTIYTLTASGAGGNTTATTTVTVTSTPQPTAPTVTSFAAMPASVSPGQTAKLTWTTANATTVTIDQGIGSKPPSGEIDVTPTSTTTYTLVANGTNGQSSPATATVTVSTGSGLSRINHILLFQQENRSFDQYFGKLDDYRVREFSLPKGQVDGIPDNASNPLFEVNQDGSRKEVGTVKPYHLRTACVDNTSPAWNEAYTQRWRNRPACAPGSCDPLDPAPPMDGFTFTATGYAYKNIEWDINGVRAMGYYTEQDLPYYYFMATQFATSNRWFSPVLTR
ncbi:MAG: alkaline phosphatase family protein, partial [Candidatus Korobacteraceae bacterium]